MHTHTQMTFPFVEPGVVDFNAPELLAEYDEVLAQLDEKLRPRIEAFQESERLTEKDFSLIINCRD